MANTQYYEAEILEALETLPAEALPKVWRLTVGAGRILSSEPGESPKLLNRQPVMRTESLLTPLRATRLRNYRGTQERL